MRKHLVAGALAAAVAGSGALALSTGVAQARAGCVAPGRGDDVHVYHAE